MTDAQSYRGGDASTPTSQRAVEVVAFYLPQFHPVPENDDWWGPGFTEWTNVAAARRLFPTHYQPRLPGELGFYDLRVAETREAQAELARSHGVTAFCYWHYWFGAGRRLLDRPFDEVLRSGSPDFPFCLGWANESWTGHWHGAPGRMLVEQRYSDAEDDRHHHDFLVQAFVDPRYFRVGGRPLFYILKPRDLPEPARFIDGLRERAAKAGVEDPFVVGEYRSPTWAPFEPGGFDGNACVSVDPEFVRRHRNGARSPGEALGLRLRKHSRRARLPRIFDYASWSPLFAWSLEEFGLGGVSFPTVVPGFDNTPRTGRLGRVFHGAHPDAFAEQVAAARSVATSSGHSLLFVKSWNEWAEGNYLEPDRRFGRAYLEALRDAVSPS